MAAQTERVRLGAMVSAVTYRPPALLIKAVTTLDVLSDGRAWLGLGAGYLEREARELGLPLPPISERFDHLEDTLELAQRMWAGRQPVLRPPPASGASLLAAAAGAKSASADPGRRQRRANDAAAGRPPRGCLQPVRHPRRGPTIRHKLEVLRAHCADVGRPFGEIEKTLSTRLGPGESVDEFADRCRWLAGLGIDHVVLLATGDWTTDAVTGLDAHIAAVR